MQEQIDSLFGRERNTPWQELGTPLKGMGSSLEAMRTSGLDWQAELIPLYAESDHTLVSSWGDSLEPQTASIDEPRKIALPGSFGVIRDRDGAVLGKAGSRYKVYQPWECFQLMDAMVKGAGALYDSAGSFSDGKVTYITMQMPENLMVAGEDPIERFLCLANSYDGSMQLTVMRTNIRIKCRNTLNLAMQTSPAMWRIRHTESITDRAEEVRKALELSDKYDDEFEATMNLLIGQDYTKADLEKDVRILWPSKDRGDGNAQKQMAALGVFEASTTVNDAWRYTKYGAIQAVAELEDWMSPRRSSKEKSFEEQQTEAVWFGTPQKVKQKFLDMLLTA